jgi:hypothetical protein
MSELSWSFPAAPKRSHKLPFSGKQGDTMAVALADIHYVIGIHSYARWKVDMLISFTTVSKYPQKDPLGGEDLYEVEIACGNVHVPTAVTCYAPGIHHLKFNRLAIKQVHHFESVAVG